MKLCRIPSLAVHACRGLLKLIRAEYAIVDHCQHRMSNTRKLRQTRLYFASTSAEQESCKKRKMESGKGETNPVVISDSPEDGVKNETIASKYFADQSATSNAGAKAEVTESKKKIDSGSDEEGGESQEENGFYEYKLGTSSTGGAEKASAQPGTSGQDEMSPELFSSQESGHNLEDSEEWDKVEQDIPAEKPKRRREDREDKCWAGVDISKLKTTKNCPGKLENLRPTDSHTILVRLPFTYREDQLPHPHPTHFHDKWDNDHVRMPCSNQNEYPKGDGKTIVKRWKLIQEALNQQIPGCYELEEAILKYNQRYERKWSFHAFHSFFTEYCIKEERDKFFNKTLPKMVKLALQLPHLCTAPIPLLKGGMKHRITMSQQQIASLLANAFFCTFPRRNSQHGRSEYSKYPSINFNTLYGGEASSRKMEKLRCIIHYFERVTEKMPAGLVTFTRQHPRHMPNWEEQDVTLTRLHVSSKGTIEDDGEGMLQVDFANKFMGGGALGSGLVQEEIRFMICPEMIITRLFTEVLGKNESLIMTGCERFSEYDGYSHTFQWTGDYVDKTKRDSWGRLDCAVTAIDALVITSHGQQFSSYSVCRELNKAFAGFSERKQELPAVCTGNWGCGAFGGDKQLKALIQLMAAACAGRDVCYFTFGNEELVHELSNIHEFIKEEFHLRIGDVVKLINQYFYNVINKRPQGKMKLFDYIIRHFENPEPSPSTEDECSNDGMEERVLMSEQERQAEDAAKCDPSTAACGEKSTQELMDNTP